MKPKKSLVVIVGPTAVGKTKVAIALAEKYNSEVISADSRQFYREMEIGTAKPNSKELEAAPHHLINSLSIQEDYDAGKFVEDANSLLSDLFRKSDTAIMVGGSGLYVKAFCDGLGEIPKVPKSFREQLNLELSENGLLPLLAELKIADPDYFERVDQGNPQRVIRGLEVTRSTGKTFTYYRGQKPGLTHNFNIIKVGLELDREILYQKINDRMDQMISDGLFEEAECLYPYRMYNSMKTVGYQEIFGYLDREYDKEEAIRLLKRNSRRYAKRQMTWFRKDEGIHWFDPANTKEIERCIECGIDSANL